jgi:excisionase family DNA binding protein
MWSDEDQQLTVGEQPSHDDVLLLRVEEAADRLGIARTMMFGLVRKGEVQSVRVGRLRRVPVACLEEYVDRLRMLQTHVGAHSDE